MALILCKNIFKWGDVYFLQLLGTAIGPSATCVWATIYFAVHEMGTLIPNVGTHLPLSIALLTILSEYGLDPLMDPSGKYSKMKQTTLEFSNGNSKSLLNQLISST